MGQKSNFALREVFNARLLRVFRQINVKQELEANRILENLPKLVVKLCLVVLSFISGIFNLDFL